MHQVQCWASSRDLVDEHATSDTENGSNNVAGVLTRKEDCWGSILLWLGRALDGGHVCTKGLCLQSQCSHASAYGNQT